MSASLFFDAAQEGSVDVVKKMVREKKELLMCKDEKGRTAVHIAAVYGHEPVVASLMGLRASILQEDSNRRTPLELALLEDHHKVANKIVQSETMGKVGLATAAIGLLARLHEFQDRTNAVKGVEFLINAGIELNWPDENGRTLLHFATLLGEISLIRMLAWKGSNMNIRDKNGDTALHLAVTMDLSKELVSCLLICGASVSLKNKAGKTPEDLVQPDRREIALLLKLQKVKSIRLIKNRLEVATSENPKNSASNLNSATSPPRGNEKDTQSSGRKVEGWLLFNERKNRRMRWLKRYCVAHNGKFEIYKVKRQPSSVAGDTPTQNDPSSLCAAKPPKKSYMIKDTTVERCLISHELTADKKRKKDRTRKEDKAVHRFEMLVFPNEKTTSLVTHLFAADTPEELSDWLNFWKDEALYYSIGSGSQPRNDGEGFSELRGAPGQSDQKGHNEITSDAFAVADNRIVVPSKIADRLTLALEQVYRVLSRNVTREVVELLVTHQEYCHTTGTQIPIMELESAYHVSPSALANAVDEAAQSPAVLIQFLFFLFDNLPEPLLSYSARDKFVEALSILHPLNRLETFRSLTLGLSGELQRRLMSLLGFCSNLVTGNDERMTFEACLNVFWFYLIRKEGDIVMGVKSYHPCPEEARMVVLFLMNHSDKLFDYTKVEETRTELENDQMAFRRRLHTDGPLFCLELDVAALDNAVIQLEMEDVPMTKWGRLEKRLDVVHHLLAEEACNTEAWQNATHRMEQVGSQLDLLESNLPDSLFDE